MPHFFVRVERSNSMSGPLAILGHTHGLMEHQLADCSLRVLGSVGAVRIVTFKLAA